MIGHTKAEGWNYFRNYNVRVVEKMIPVEIRGYVLEDEYRWTNKWITLIGAISLILVSVACLYLEIKAQENLLPSLVFAAVSGSFPLTLR